ncbi:hypothetical protein BGZ47_002753 [Haplosporangium gracile]|nr:hypothetical protein BGZ47_002753 [Haplosporangium gracile]
MEIGSRFTEYFEKCQALKYRGESIPGILFRSIRLCKVLGASPKRPDLIVKRKNRTYIGFGEMSFTKEFSRIKGVCIDLRSGRSGLRIIWLRSRFTKCAALAQSVATELARLKITQNLEGLLAFEAQIES